jgi:hypothetical protein
MAGLNMYLQGGVFAIPGKVKLASVDESNMRRNSSSLFNDLTSNQAARPNGKPQLTEMGFELLVEGRGEPPSDCNPTQ